MCDTNALPAAEHNTDMLINNALMGGESEVAMAWSRRLAQYPTLLPTGAYGDASADWTHLPLVQVCVAAPAVGRF